MVAAVVEEEEAFSVVEELAGTLGLELGYCPTGVDGLG